jgi:hypothetical protein
MVRTVTWLWRLRHVVPVTPLGLGVALGGVWLSFAVGAKEVDYVLLAGGLVAAGAVGLALVLVLAASLRLWPVLRRARHPGEAEPLSLETGLTADTGLALPGLDGWPLVSLRVVWEHPSRVEVTLKRRAGRQEELVRPLSRGKSPVIRRRLLVEDIFGFARLGLPLTTEQRVRVNPSLAQLTAHVVTRFLGGDALSHPSGPVEGEPIEMRRYVYGDPLRNVLWKAFARTRKLLVRTPERAITPRPSAAAYLVAGPGDEPAASAARFFVEKGMLGKEFAFCADGADAPTGEPEQALDQIVESAHHRRHGGEGLARMLRRLTPQQIDALVLFVPAEPGRWLDRIDELASRLRHVRAITAVDDAPQAGARGLGVLRNLLLTPRSEAASVARRLGKVVGRLGRAGLAVQVIHRPSGELLSHAQLETLPGQETRTARARAATAVPSHGARR